MSKKEKVAVIVIGFVFVLFELFAVGTIAETYASIYADETQQMVDRILYDNGCSKYIDSDGVSWIIPTK